MISKVVNIRMSDYDKRELIDASVKLGLTYSEFIKVAIKKMIYNDTAINKNNEQNAKRDTSSSGDFVYNIVHK